MPEGDTVHRWAAQLEAALAGRELKRVEVRRDPRGVRPPDAGVHVTAVEAHGKHLLVHFDDGATLHTHMQVQGIWHVYRPRARWRRPAHKARVVLEVDDGTTAVCFDAPVVELRRAQARPLPTRALRSLDRLGPDLCGEHADIDRVLDRMRAVPEETPVGDVLLDQKVAAGVGNVFKSEICWACGVHPSTPIGMLPESDRRKIYETAHTQLHANLGGGRRVTFRGGLAVYGKVRRPCPRCRTPIRRAWEGADARVTYWCPRCQPAPLAAATPRLEE